MYKRKISLTTSSRKSLFFFGPRQTGKSTLIKELFPRAHKINLLNQKTYREYLATPELLYERLVLYKDTLVIIDEIQRIPSLLNTVHQLIEENALRFILTGSSAQKLRRTGTNLLGGRALEVNLYPITYPEFLTDAAGRDAVETLTQVGGLPSILNSPDPYEDMEGYVNLYLYQEIKEEAHVRSLSAFSKFLTIAAYQTGEQLNYTAIASDVGISRVTVYEYFKILEDTLMGNILEPFKSSLRKSVSSPKFYLFDVGLANFLSRRWGAKPGSKDFGTSFEHFVWRELKSYLAYNKVRFSIAYWRSRDRAAKEIDFIVYRDEKNPEFAIEVKTTKEVTSRDLEGLLSFSEEFKSVRKILVCMEDEKRLKSGVEIWPIRSFLDALWNREIII